VEAKHSPDGVADTIIVVLNLDPHSTREGLVYLDLGALGVDFPGSWEAPAFAAHDLLNGATYAWGAHAFVRLDPHTAPGHVIHVQAL
jgi:starch synthase (maltosyl-transferring)